MIMKIASILAITLAFTLTVVTAAQGAGPEKTPAVYTKVFVPKGFDSNDHIQIVGVGQFENGCYRPAETTAKVDEASKRITLTAAAYKYNGLCVQMILKFDRVIDVGVVPAGEYEIYQEGQSELLGKLNVKASRSESPDDFLYAPVRQAYIDDDGAISELVIKGDFPSSCMQITDVKIEAVNNVIIAQPIMRVQRREDCALGHYPFRKVVRLNVPKGEYLLHIRSMNAKAVNNLVDIP